MRRAILLAILLTSSTAAAREETPRQWECGHAVSMRLEREREEREAHEAAQRNHKLEIAAGVGTLALIAGVFLLGRRAARGVA